MAELLAPAGSVRTSRGCGTSHIGRSRETERRHSDSVRRRVLAALTHALHDKLADASSEANAALGCWDGTHQLPAAACTGGASPAREGSRAAVTERFPQAASTLDEAGADILAFTHFPLEEELVERPAGEDDLGDTM